MFGGALRIAEFLECRVFRAPCAVGFAINGELVFGSRICIKHRELPVGREQRLVVMRSVEIDEVFAEAFEQGECDW